jgi:hypothetical protein
MKKINLNIPFTAHQYRLLKKVKMHIASSIHKEAEWDLVFVGLAKMYLDINARGAK